MLGRYVVNHLGKSGSKMLTKARLKDKLHRQFGILVDEKTVSGMFRDIDPEERGQIEISKFLCWLFPTDFSGKSVAVSQQPELDIFDNKLAPTRGRTLGMTSTTLAPPTSVIQKGQSTAEVFNSVVDRSHIYIYIYIMINTYIN